MNIRVRLFASLRERLQLDQVELSAEGLTTVADVWQALTGEPWSRQVLAAVNWEYALPETEVKAGDEVAFFPPVTGG
ncbi:MAG: MoaD/ThiS family protein [Methylohalobius sp.]|nr:MoaD/ThiS family protein [Methylohalobius sp.]